MRNSRGGELNYRTKNVDRRSFELKTGHEELKEGEEAADAAAATGGEGGVALEVADGEEEEGGREILRTASDWERIALVERLRKDVDSR